MRARGRRLTAILRLGLAGMLMLVLGGCIVEEETVTQADLDLLLRASDFRALGFDFVEVAPFEEVVKQRYYDGSYELEYRFEPDDAFFLYSMLSIEREKASAVMTYKASSVGFDLGYTGSEIELVEDDAFYRYGDQSRFARLMHEGEEVGNLFMTRVDKRVYAFICVGAYFDDAKLWAELIEPRLIAFDRYEPSPGAE